MTRSSRAAEVIRLFVCAFRDELKSRFVDEPSESPGDAPPRPASLPPVNVWRRVDRAAVN